MDGRFTDEELAIAKSVDLCAVAESLGYTVKRIGKYHTLKEMDSIRIYNRSHWYRWSRQFDKGNNGGSQIDFLRVFCGMSVKEAVFWLLDFAGYRRIENPVKQPLVHQVSQKQAEERKPFVLPEPAGDNSYLISYLNQERGISRAVIDLFLKDGLIYESRHYHNVVFKGNDKNGVTRFASMRGVFDKQGKGEFFVSMPRYRSNERDESNGVIYKDVCNPITAEFREELYTNILDAYARIKEPEKEETQKQDRTQEIPEFSVTVTPYEREGSNIKGLARIYFENSFIVNNINIVQGKEKIFVSMPSYKTKQVDEQGKPIYQDVCYPVTKDFRERLYNEIISEYEKAKDKSNEKARESAEKHHGNPDKEKDKEATPFR